MKSIVRLWAIILLALLAGCKSEPPLTPAIGEGFVGPATLRVRQDIAIQSKVVATVSHGQRLEILQRRRRFIKVRTPLKVEGWTEERQLMTAEQLGNLRSLSEHSKSAPSQGAATTYDVLNVHTEPDRLSPSFLQVREGEKVEVIGRRVSPRSSPLPPKPVVLAPAPRKKSKKTKTRKADEVPPPPMPRAPKLPDDWLELSAVGTEEEEAEEPPPVAPTPVPMDDWSLIRDAAGRSGWVLTRRLVMAIPDEVAQYAEGRRICAYFSLGSTRDGENVKPSWLWATVERGLESHDFDSIRVFTWSLRRHRYETAHIERNLKGFFPLLTHPVAAPKGHGDWGEKVPGFSVLVEKKDGLRYRRNYAFFGNLVRLSSEERADAPAGLSLAQAKQPGPAPQAAVDSESVFRSMKRRLIEMSRRYLGI